MGTVGGGGGARKRRRRGGWATSTRREGVMEINKDRRKSCQGFLRVVNGYILATKRGDQEERVLRSGC